MPEAPPTAEAAEAGSGGRGRAAAGSTAGCRGDRRAETRPVGARAPSRRRRRRPPRRPETLPPPAADTGELAARPETEATAPEAEATARADTADDPPAETEPASRRRADAAPKPERTEVADALPPPEPVVERDQPKETTPAEPAAPPPSAPSAASTAARSGGAGGGGASQTAGNAAASAYRAKVAAQLERKSFYPNAARRDRLTGAATVSFTLNAAGRVTAVRVVRSAGARILDEAALEMVRRASPYPPIPAGLGATITIQAPIAFDLPR